jgi:hypothetical protein
MEDYFRNGKKVNGEPLYTSVEYIGEFVDVIYTDVDTEVGIGNRRIPGGCIRTAKYIYQLRSKKDEGDYFQYLREYHLGLQWYVKDAWERKQEAKRKRDERKS